MTDENYCWVCGAPLDGDDRTVNVLVDQQRAVCELCYQDRDFERGGRDENRR